MTLKAVRVVSTYNACAYLIPVGYGQEVCALIRTAFEFLNDIHFIAEGVQKGTMTPQQQEMLDRFFEEDLLLPELLLNRHSKKPTVPRKKVYAHVARNLTPDNPDRTQKLIRLLEEAYSGYIHGAYPHVMELYVGGDWRFHTGGMPGTPRKFESLRALVRSVHQALNVFARVSALFANEELFNALLATRKILEVNKLYAG